MDEFYSYLLGTKDLGPVTRVGNRLRSFCPFHTENDPSFFLNLETLFYTCYGCGKTGPLVQLLRRVFGLDYLKAKDVERRFKVNAAFRSITEKEEKQRLYRQPYMSYAPVSLVERGFDEEFLYRMDVGYDPYELRVVFMVYDSSGTLTGHYYRTDSDSQTKRPRYYGYFNTHDCVYNPSRDWSGGVVLVEGPVDALAVVYRMECFEPLGYNAACSMFGLGMSDEQGIVLARHFEKILLMVDNDNPAREATPKLLSLLHRTGNRNLAIAVYDGDDPGSLEFTKVKPDFRTWRYL